MNYNNVLMGSNSGYNADNIDSCIMIGSNSGYNANNSSNSILIGVWERAAKFDMKVTNPQKRRDNVALRKQEKIEARRKAGRSRKKAS